MKRQGLPIWLLRDLPAFLGVMISFWPLMILVITNGFKAMRGKKVPRSAFDDFPILLAHAESRLDFAIWREAYRRLGWNPRDVEFTLVEASDDWDETTRRFQSYQRASRNLEACARHYVDVLRQRYRIAAREAHGSTDARLCRAAHHELVDVAALNVGGSVALMVSSARSARPSNHEGVLANARGPPTHPISRNPTHPTSHALGARECLLMSAYYELILGGSRSPLTISATPSLTINRPSAAGILRRPRRSPINIHAC